MGTARGTSFPASSPLAGEDTDGGEPGSSPYPDLPPPRGEWTTDNHHLTCIRSRQASGRKLQLPPGPQLLREQCMIEKGVQRCRDSDLGAKTDQGAGQRIQF